MSRLVMDSYTPYLDWIDGQKDRMIATVLEWGRIHTGTYNTAGLARFLPLVRTEAGVLGGQMEELPLAPQTVIDASGNAGFRELGNVLRIRKRPEADLRVFLGIHMDVVYEEGAKGTEDPVPVWLDANTIQGSGLTDAKGGMVILLTALQALERSPFAAGLGWEVLFNSDEEIGSPGSRPLLYEAAARNSLGLLYEPALPDGNLVGARKGSGNFTVVIRGRAAHAGREPHLGRNAINALAEFIISLNRIPENSGGLTLNVGKVEGGGPVNRVPDLAIVRFNVRAENPDEMDWAEERLHALVQDMNRRDGIFLELHGGFFSPPKGLGEETLDLLRGVKQCGHELGLDLEWQSSGGVSDGNKLAAAGLPNVDTLGARGGNIHSPTEFLSVDSLVERARLSALLLMKIAAGEIPWKRTDSQAG